MTLVLYLSINAYFFKCKLTLCTVTHYGYVLRCCVTLLQQARLALDDAGDVVPVARALTSLLLPSYYPQGADVTGEEQVILLLLLLLLFAKSLKLLFCTRQ
jgi:hypothetical protein